jgi:predicted Rossmann-fold nucleotide-binding protein
VPINQYDTLLGGPGAADELMRALTKQYGPRKARDVFYALVKKAQKGKGSKSKKGALRKKMAQRRDRLTPGDTVDQPKRSGY